VRNLKEKEGDLSFEESGKSENFQEEWRQVLSIGGRVLCVSCFLEHKIVGDFVIVGMNTSKVYCKHLCKCYSETPWRINVC
jgi:hypothetical protein